MSGMWPQPDVAALVVSSSPSLPLITGWAEHLAGSLGRVKVLQVARLTRRADGESVKYLGRVILFLVLLPITPRNGALPSDTCLSDLQIGFNY